MARVLVCSDERHISRLIQVSLDRQGYEVAACETGAECLARLRREPFHFLVVDDWDGLPTREDVLKEIQEDPSLNVRVMDLRKKGDSPTPPQKPFGGSPPAVASNIPSLAELLNALSR